jgi:hypothetical protein
VDTIVVGADPILKMDSSDAYQSQPDCVGQPSRAASGKVGAMSKSTSIEPGASPQGYHLYVELEWVRPSLRSCAHFIAKQALSQGAA